MVASKLIIEDAEISITHHECNDASSYKNKELFVASKPTASS